MSGFVEAAISEAPVVRRRRGMQVASAARVMIAATLTGAALLTGSGVARAHAVGLSQGQYRLTDAGVEVHLTFAAGEVGHWLVPAAPQDFERLVVIDVEGARCAGTAATLGQDPPDAVSVSLAYRCASLATGQGVRISLEPLFEELPHGHRHQATHSEQTTHSEQALPDAGQTLVIAKGAAQFMLRTPAAGQGQPARTAMVGGHGGLLLMGVEHILSGFDHLLLLAALVVVPLTWRSVLLTVTAFTVAHSLSLAWAVLGGWTPPSVLVEPAIAATIVVVGLSNVRQCERVPRRLASFAFGLIHGLGFAGALLDLGLSGFASVGPLLQFNVGVEIGQVAVLAALLPAFHWVRPRWRGVITAANWGVCLIGAVWFIERVVEGLAG